MNKIDNLSRMHLESKIQSKNHGRRRFTIRVGKAVEPVHRLVGKSVEREFWNIGCLVVAQSLC